MSWRRSKVASAPQRFDALTWYEQLPQTGLPSERSSKLVSAETLSPHFAHLKQSTCHREELWG